MHNLKAHLIHYLFLLLILGGGLGFFLRFRFYPKAQFVTVALTTLGYIVWGITHHYLEDRLSLGVILEYLLLGLLVISLFWFTLSPF